MESETAVPCLVCSAPSGFYISIPQGGQMRLCNSCGLIFAHPMDVPVSPQELFTKAYEGKFSGAEMDQFHQRLRLRSFFLRNPELSLWSTCYSAALEYLEASIARGSSVLEIGCGMGMFMHTLRSKGYEATALDVAEPVVHLLTREGFRVWLGTLETLPSSWPEPAAVCSFFVLHHLSDPVGFIRLVRERFPLCPIILGAYDRSKHQVDVSLGDQSAYPPRSLAWWTDESIRHLLAEAGYEAQVSVLRERLPLPAPRSAMMKMGELLRLQPAYPLYARFTRVLSQVRQAFGRATGDSTKAPTRTILAVGVPTDRSRS